MGWVTIKGRHVLIEDNQARLTGGGHDGTHDPATSTGNKHSDSAVIGKSDSNIAAGYTEKEYPKLFVDPVLKSRLQPALKTPSGQIQVGNRGQYHWEMAPLKPGETFYPDYIRKGWKRGFVDPITKTYYDAAKLGLDASEIGSRPAWLRNP